MSCIIKFVIVLILVECTIELMVFARGSSVSRAFVVNGIVPDVVPVPPHCELKVKYPSGVAVNFGNELTPTEVKDEPSVSWHAKPDKYYMLAMTDPDVPSRKEPTSGEVQHWLVGNIPGNKLTSGEVISQYIGSAPEEGTGLHRYVFLVYQQPEKLTFDEPRVTNRSADHRVEFSIAKFATKYNLGDPISGNFYQAQYDDYVPVLRQSLGI